MYSFCLVLAAFCRPLCWVVVALYRVWVWWVVEMVGAVTGKGRGCHWEVGVFRDVLIG